MVTTKTQLLFYVCAAICLAEHVVVRQVVSLASQEDQFLLEEGFVCARMELLTIQRPELAPHVLIRV